MARQNKVTTFEALPTNQCFQIVDNGFPGTVYAKRDHWTALVVTSPSAERPAGKIVDLRKDTQVIRCLSPEQRQRRTQKQVA